LETKIAIILTPSLNPEPIIVWIQRGSKNVSPAGELNRAEKSVTVT
jgi:hypothetical protein